MKQENVANLVIGLAAGVAATYFVCKHKDEIMDKLHEIEDNLDHFEWVKKVKMRIEQLSHSFHTHLEKMNTETDETAQESQVSHILDELNQLRKDVELLDPKRA